MMLHVMGEMVRLRKAIKGLRCVHSAEGKVVKEGGEFSGRHGVQEADASVMEESDKGKAQGKPVPPVKAPCVQAGVCNSGCDNAAGAVGGTPDQP